MLHLPAIAILFAFTSQPLPCEPSAHTVGRTVALTRATQAAAPRDLPTLHEAYEHVTAAISAERPGVSATLLLALAHVETHYTATATSRGGRYCGVVQATKDKYGYTCADLHTLATGYLAGAESVERWLKVCRKWKRGERRLRCALRGYGGVSVNGSTGYPGAVLRQRKRIQREVNVPRGSKMLLPLQS